MPALIVAVVSAIASIAIANAPVIIGALGTIGASIAGAVVGTLLTVGLSYAFGLNKPKKASGSSAPLTSRAQDTRVLVRSAIEPQRIVYGRARVSGPILYAASSGTDQEILHLVVPVCGCRIDRIETVWLNDDPIELADMGGTSGLRPVIAGKYAGKVSIARYTGAQTTGDPDLIAESPDGWGASDKLTGHAYLYVRLTYDRDLFTGGVPNISALVVGRADIVDTRSSVTGWTDNWALCIRDYLLADFGRAVPADAIDEASFIAAANLSDEDVDLDAGGTTTQKRYTLNGVVSLDRAPADILQEMLDAGGGALVYVAGKFRLYGGAYAAPSASIGVSDLAGPVVVRPRPSRRELFNAVRGTFIDPARFWQASEFGQITNSIFEAQDGERLWRDIELPFVNDYTRAQRIAYQALRRARESITVEVPLRFASLNLAVWQTVALTIPDLGFSAKAFRLVSWEFSPAEGIINVTMQEDEVASYAWVWDDAVAVPASPDTTLISPLGIPTPTSLSVSASTVLNGDGGVEPALVVTWASTPHAFVTGHEVQWRVSPAGAWSSLEVPVGTLRAVIAPVIVGTSYDVRVRAIAGLARSAYTSTSTAAAAADTTAPAAPSGANVAGIPRGFTIAWTPATDADLYATRVHIWTGSAWSYIGESQGTRFTYPSGPGTTSTFGVQSVDRSGNTSAIISAGAATVPRLATDDLQDLSISNITASATTSLSVGTSWSAVITISAGNASFANRFVIQAGVKNPETLSSGTPTVIEARIRRGADGSILDQGRITVANADASLALLAADLASAGVKTYYLDMKADAAFTASLSYLLANMAISEAYR